MPSIDMVRTGENIALLRKQNKLTVKDVQNALGFNHPTAIFRWQRGETLPSLDNLVILADLFHVAISDIIVVNR